MGSEDGKENVGGRPTNLSDGSLYGTNTCLTNIAREF